MISIPITVLFIGLFVVLQIPLTVMVGYRRARKGIQFWCLSRGSGAAELNG